MNIAETGKTWEGRIVDARLPLRQRLGSSDHSSVYLTEIAGPGSPKAVVKIFPADFFDAARQLPRWRTLTQLNNVALLRLLDGGQSNIDGTPFFFVVTDFVEEDLSQILPQRALTAGEVTDLLPPVLEGLAYLHKNGFVHGHIQPSNIMAKGDKIKLPVERVYALGDRRDKNSPVGPYAAPETALGAFTPAADVWSLGMFLIAALTQKPLSFPGNIPTAPAIPAGIPEPLRSIIADCLVLDPKERCSITEIGAWIRPAQAPPAVSSKSPAPPKPVAKPVPPPSPSPAPIKKVSPTPTGNRKSGWRIGAVIAAIVIIGAMVLEQKMVSRKQQPGPAVNQAATEPTPAPAAAPIPAPPEDPIRHRVVPGISANTKRKIHGVIKVSVHVDVDPSGKVIAAKIVSPSSSQYFNNLSQESAEQWEFSPPQENGTPEPSAWLLRFQFSRRSSEVLPSRITATASR
ncbi:MAG: TonB family protein [Candidatus Sulfotelmatobacter sp.]